MKITLHSENVEIGGSEYVKLVKIGSVGSVVDLLGFGMRLKVPSVELVLSFRDVPENSAWTGPVMAGLLPGGYVERVRNNVAWTAATAAKLNGLVPISQPGKVEGCVVTRRFNLKLTNVCEINEAVTEWLVVAVPYRSGTDPLVSVMCMIDVELE